MQNQYIAINASAGSGKTYNLVQRVLMICLQKPNNHTVVSNILALTFTNKAANEMKQRILEWLAGFSKENYSENKELLNLQKQIQNTGTEITLDELHLRSKKLLDYILHHYSNLHIGTIDKFNSRLVKSFSQELGIARNFNLEMDSQPFVIEAVDQIIDQIGENDDISQQFLDYVNYNLDNEERISINKVLYQSAQKYTEDVHYEKLKMNSKFDDEKYKIATEKLRNDIHHLKKQNFEIAKESEKLIESKGLCIKDFAGGKTNSIASFFNKYINQNYKFRKSREATEKDYLNFKKGASNNGKKKEAQIFEILDVLIQNYSIICKNEVQMRLNKLILKNLLPLKLNKDIQHQLEQIISENDIVLMKKFNILIHENLKNEPSQFIYEKIGTQFQHFFFDEFQDTSFLQWQNFLPLRDHSVSQDGTSFTIVGDPKQSIYRFRGGDSQLMLNIILHHEKTPKKAEVIQLKDNWRSAKNIVDFNNKMYSEISKNLADYHQSIFDENTQQTPQSDKNGRVKVSLFEGANYEEKDNQISEKMHANIQELLDSGYQFSDIAIICRKNKEISGLVQKLGSKTVKYNGNWENIKTISDSGLTLDLSPSIKALIFFLKWQVKKENLQNLVEMMHWLCISGRIKMVDFTKEIAEILAYTNEEEILDFISSKYNFPIHLKHEKSLNLYHYIEYYLKIFITQDKETDFVLNFLEMVYNYSQNIHSTLKDFIQFWDEEGSKTKILASENIDAIQLLTIHKSKGLEFPVVFVPVLNNSKDEYDDWLPVEEIDGLSYINTKTVDKVITAYHPKINDIVTQKSLQNHLDQICVDYVATTRAVDQLHLFVEKIKNLDDTKDNRGIYSFVQKYNPENKDVFDVYDNYEKVKKQKEIKAKKQQAICMKNIFHRNEQLNNIKIATPSKNYQDRNEKVKRGIFVHEMISKINNKNDVSKVVESYLLNGIISIYEQNEITEYLNSIIEKHPYIFPEQGIIYNEKEIMIQHNNCTEILRPDRLIETPNGWVVIDFKTGQEKPEHQKQISIYKNALENLGKKVVQTHLIYI